MSEAVNVAALKQKIIEAGISGKYTEFHNSLEEIDLSIKQHSLEIPNSAKIFEIPQNWKWVRLGWIMDIERGGSPRPIKSYLTHDSNGINWIKIGDVEKDGKYIEKTEEKIIPEGMNKSRKVYPGDFLLTNSMSFGRPYISKIEGCVHDGWLVLRNREKLFDFDYLYILLSSKYVYNQFVTKASGSTVDNLNKDKVAEAIVPLPPLSEQKRIVAKIEDLMTDIDKIERLQSAYTANQDALKKKIIEAGITGKLVPQIASEGTAEALLKEIEAERAALIKAGKIKKEKSLPEITEDEIPFEIPKSWKWVRVGNIMSPIMGQSPDGKNVGNFLEGVEFHQGKLYFSDTYLVETKIKTRQITKITPVNSVLISVRAPVGAVNITRREICIGRGLCSLPPQSTLDVLYVFYAFTILKTELIKKETGTTFNAISADIVHKQLFPLPPLSEQKRIVAKIEELMQSITSFSKINRMSQG